MYQNKYKFRHVGEEVQVGNVTLKVVAHTGTDHKCRNCYFRPACCMIDLELIPKIIGPCLLEEREDDIDVWFLEVKNK